MDLLTGGDFDSLFTSFDHTAWRLETREAYNIDQETESFQRYLTTGVVEDDSQHPWMVNVREATAQGKRFARVRVVPNPLTDYLRFEAAACRYNVDAGEDIRYLDVDRAVQLGLTRRDDFWLFDSTRIARLHFDDHDRLLGVEIIHDCEQVVEANRLRDIAWHYAIPYDVWWPRVDGAGDQRRPGT